MFALVLLLNSFTALAEENSTNSNPGKQLVESERVCKDGTKVKAYVKAVVNGTPIHGYFCPEDIKK